MSEVNYVCKWTTEVDEQFLKDWQYVENTVFGGFDDDVIKRKYLDNIYGPSIMAVAYLDGKPVGADAMWRNDVNGKEAYESSDTCVLKEARGHGIMTGITKSEVAKVPSNSYIYGSPNGKSYFGYKKMGWDEVELYPGIFICPKTYSKQCPQIMPYEYATWWIVGDNKYHIKRKGHYYLVSKYSSEPFWLAHLIAEVDKKTAELYPRFKGISLFIYRSFKKPLYARLLRKRAAMHHISPNGDPKKFPYWKIDGYGE